MKKSELIKLKKLLQQEIDRRKRINELLSNDLIQEFLSLNKLNINQLQSDDKWIILKELLKDFQITESNGILVYIGSYLTACSICYQDTDYRSKKVSFDSPYKEYEMFQDIETAKIHVGYCDSYIKRRTDEESKSFHGINITPSEFCHKRYNRYLVSELMKKYIILNPYNKPKNNNEFQDIQKDFFTTAIEKGQSKAKQLVLNKYPQVKQ